MRVLVVVLLLGSAMAQEGVRQQIRSVASAAKGRVSVACALPGSTLNCDVNAEAHSPMQSVFKLPLAMTVLHEVEQGRLTLDEPVRFRPEDRFVPKAYSPLQEKYPEAGVDVPLRNLLQMTTQLSDNAAADMLVRLVGGTGVVEAYVRSLGIAEFQLSDDEHALHRSTRLQYRNWFAARDAVRLLRRIADDSPLTAEHTALLLEWMRPATPSARLGAQLPPSVQLLHKSGTSDVEAGVAAATNDIGLVKLPDGRQVAVAVFVTDSRAEGTVREQVIGRIGRVVYEAALRAK